jgi:hypothetical protein
MYSCQNCQIISALRYKNCHKAFQILYLFFFSNNANASTVPYLSPANFASLFRQVASKNDRFSHGVENGEPDDKQQKRLGMGTRVEGKFNYICFFVSLLDPVAICNKARLDQAAARATSFRQLFWRSEPGSPMGYNVAAEDETHEPSDWMMG